MSILFKIRTLGFQKPYLSAFIAGNHCTFPGFLEGDGRRLHGYLDHKKVPPPGTLQGYLEGS